MPVARQCDIEAILPFATPEQAVKLRAVMQHGTHEKAARALGLNERTVQRAVQHVKARAAIQGHAPEHDMTRTVPDGFTVRGVSTLYNGKGVPVSQWVKSGADDQRRMEMLRDAIAAMADELPRLKPLPAPKIKAPDLLNLFTLTDCHVGMLAWHKEGGADWDLGIAERTLTGCFQHMLDNAPAADTCVIAQLGDWLHQDGLNAVTPTSGHLLDSDGRFSKVVAAAIRILRRVIDSALAKHRRVIVLMAEGNHDMASAVWLRHMFAALYEREKRVQVIDTELPYYAIQHGKTMLCWHHGHIKKNDELPLLFAAQFPDLWGQTRKRYCHTGHRHHVEEKEHSGMTVVQHPTLAARDAYASRGGWISERQAQAITYHKEFGQVGRNIVTPEMLEAA